MENGFRMKKINTKEEVEFHNQGNKCDLDTVGGDNWNKFNGCNDEDELEYCKLSPQLLVNNVK